MMGVMICGSDYGLAHARELSRRVRELTKLHTHNMMVEKKLYLLSYQGGRDHVIRWLGGERRLSAWERAKTREAARVAAAHRKRPPKWWLERHHARLKAEAERTRHFARPDSDNPGTYVGTPDYALQPLRRGPSILRGCSLARRPPRPGRGPHGIDFLPTIFFTPDELRPTPAGPAQAQQKAQQKAQQSAARANKPQKPKPQNHKPPKTRRETAPMAAPKPPPQTGVVWEHISAQQAIAEIFGEPNARGSPKAA